MARQRVAQHGRVARAALMALVVAIGVSPVVPVVTPSAHAAPRTYTWSGGGATNGWGDGANWQGNEAPPAGGETIVDLSGAGVVTITGASGSILSLTVKDGTTLSGGTLVVTESFTAICARLQFGELTVSGTGTLAGGEISDRFVYAGSGLVHRPPQADECLSTDGGMKTTQTYVSAGARVVIDGTWKGRGGVLLGRSCCGAATSSTVEQGPTGVLRGDTSAGLALSSLVLEASGRFEGPVTIDASRTTLAGQAALGGRGIRPGARVVLRGNGSTKVTGLVTIHRGGVLELADENTQLVGPGRLDSPISPTAQPPGVLRFDGGQVLNRITVGPTAKTVKIGPRTLAVRTLDAKSGELVATGPASLAGSGELSIDALASVALRGETAVTGTVNVHGTSCCRVTEIPTVTISGTTTIGAGDRLSVANARLALTGATAGAGLLDLADGVHTVATDASFGSATRLRDGTVTLPDGLVTVARRFELAGGLLAGPTSRGEAVLAGKGSMLWTDGGIDGSVRISLPIDAPAAGPNTGRGVLGTLTTTARFELTGAFVLPGDTSLHLDGTTVFTRADVIAAGAPNPRIVVGATGSLRLAGGTTTADGADLRVSGALDLGGRRLALGDATATLTGGRLTLGDGVLTTSRLTADAASVVVAPGVITGSVSTRSTVRFADRGRLSIGGDLDTFAATRIALSGRGAGDVIVVDGAADLGGNLALSGFARPASAPVVLLRAASRTGTFATVSGSPSGATVAYTGASVRLERR